MSDSETKAPTLVEQPPCPEGFPPELWKLHPNAPPGTLIELNPSTNRPWSYCPKGHRTRTRFNKAYCSQERCGDDAMKALELQALQEAEAARLAQLEKEAPMDFRLLQRQATVPIPPGLTGDAATRWAQEQLVNMLPEAVAEIAWVMKYGSDKQRMEASDRVLAANGLSKREAAAAPNAGMIVLNFGSGATGVPWLDRVKSVTEKLNPSGEIDVSPITAPKKKTNGEE